MRACSNTPMRGRGCVPRRTAQPQAVTAYTHHIILDEGHEAEGGWEEGVVNRAKRRWTQTSAFLARWRLQSCCGAPRCDST